MKKIKVYLQYPWKFPDSPYYKYLVDSPPEGIEFQNVGKQKGVITNKKFFWFSNFLKRNIRRWANKLNLVIPNAHLSPKGDYDLIHCAHCLSKNMDKPWVADIEMPWSIMVSGYTSKIGKNKMQKILFEKNCKKIMPWSKWVEKIFLKDFPELKNKTEVVYPAVPEVKGINKGSGAKRRIIFIGRYFEIKGGRMALEVMNKLGEDKNIECIMISSVPRHLKNKYSKNIEIYELMPQRKLFELMKRADVLLYPGISETFGFSFLEAMSFGIVTVGLNTSMTPSIKEIIKDGETGFIINSEKDPILNEITKNEERIIEELILRCRRLVNNPALLKKMSKNCLNEIKKGKFSIKERNKKLKRIYMEALNDKKIGKIK